MFTTVKRTWRLVIGVSLFISGMAHTSQDLMAGRLTAGLGLAFIMWHVVFLLSKRKNNPQN